MVKCATKTVFHGFLGKYCVFWKNYWIKKYLASNLWLKKKVLFIFGVRWSLVGRTATHRPTRKQSYSWGGKSYFYVLKYRSSDALPTSKISLIFYFFLHFFPSWFWPFKKLWAPWIITPFPTMSLGLPLPHHFRSAPNFAIDKQISNNYCFWFWNTALMNFW